MNADLHVHTNYSFCAPQTTVPESYLPLCGEENIEILGFSNHIYYQDRLGWRNIDAASGGEYASRLRKDLERLKNETDVTLLLGAEVEVVSGMPPSLTVEESEKFDYVLLAPSHVMNLRDYFDRAGVDLSTKEMIAAVTIERHKFACGLEYPVPMGICHPLYPICTGEWEQDIVDGFSDNLLGEMFTLAKNGNKSIEIHVDLIRNGTKKDSDGLSPSYLRYLSIAKECGCRFHFGGDAHVPGSFSGVHHYLRLAAKKTGIGEDDLWTFPIK